MIKAIQNLFLTTLLFFLFTTLSFADLPPDPGGGPGGGDDPVGGGSNIGGGIVILISLGIGYGIKRIYDARKKIQEN